MSSHHSTWEDFFMESLRLMYAYAYRLTRRKADYAEDLVQDTIVKILQSGCKISELNKPPLAYVRRTMLNTWIDRIRRAKRAHLESLDDLSNLKLQKELPVHDPVVQRNFENKELLETITPKIGPLSSDEMRLFKLACQGLNCEEMSERLSEDVRITRANFNALKAKLRYRAKKNQK